jgi:hypothetical protein
MQGKEGSAGLDLFAWLGVNLNSSTCLHRFALSGATCAKAPSANSHSEGVHLNNFSTLCGGYNVLLFGHRQGGVWVSALCLNHPAPTIHGSAILERICWIHDWSYACSIEHLASHHNR